MTVLGPVVTVALALAGMAALGDRFDEVEDRGERQALALDLKFGVTGLNGWQTAYGYDDGRSRPRFVASRETVRSQPARARRRLTDAREPRLVGRLGRELDAFLRLDEEAYGALQPGERERVRRIFLGPEIERFEAMAATAERLAAYETSRAAATRRAFADERRDIRRGLVAVGLVAAVLIVRLLVTAQDVVRLALERRAHA